MFKKIIIFGMSTLFTLSSFADGDLILDGEIPLIWQPIITVSAGPAWASPGQDLYVYPFLPFQQINYYQTNSTNNTLGTGEIFFGLQRLVYPCITGELGLGFAGASDANVTGVVAVNTIPNVSTFDYKVNHARTELKGRLLANNFWLQPYVSGSLGAAWNNSHEFRATTIDPVFFPAPWFTSNTTVAFSYTLGVGVQAPINRNWQVGVGYQFADWGKSLLGIDAYTQISGPFLTHLYTNELLFNISFLY